jgi:predicted permease
MLVRVRMRITEMSIRGALGASVGRLARQSLTESLVLAVIGGVGGLMFAWAGIRLLLSLQPANVPRLETASISGPVLLFSIGVSTFVALLSGVLPAIQAGRFDLVERLKDHCRGSLGGSKTRLLGSLVVVEVALSMVLLLGAGAMLRTFVTLQAIRPGFEPDGALAVTIRLHDPDRYNNRDAAIAFYHELEEQLRSLPGVEAVGTASAVPFTRDPGSWTYAWDEESESRSDARAHVRIVTGDYFNAMQTRMLAGRAFSGREVAGRTASVIVDETVAERAWPTEDPVGKTLITSPNRLEMEVVGVVERAYIHSIREDARGTIYLPFASRAQRMMDIVVRGSGDPGSLVTPIRDEIRALDPGLAITNVTMLEDLVEDVLAPERFAFLMMSIFAGLALILATVGLYGVIAYVVGERTAEIGMRMALGADKVRVLKPVVGKALLLIAVGAVIGVLATLGLSRLAANVVYGVSATDAKSLIVVALVLSAAGLLASYMPARRAMNVDPVAALRGE